MPASSPEPMSAKQPRVRRVADLLADTLERLGVEVVFALPGGAIASLLDALTDHTAIRVVCSRTEAGATFAAAAHARYSGRPGVVLVTSGPGAINAMTGLASAQLDGLPLIVITGDVPRTNVGRNAMQDGSAHGLDIASVARSLCARVFNITRPDSAEAAFVLAYQTAMSPRRNAVFISIPMDVAATPSAGTGFTDAWHTQSTETFVVNSAEVANAATLLTEAKHPLIVVGSGARHGSGPETVQRLAEHFDTPVVTTPKAKGAFPEDHHLSLGVFGHGGHPSAIAYVEEGPDVVMVLGSSLGEAATNGWEAKLGGESLVQVDVDATQFGRAYRPRIALLGTIENIGARLIGSCDPVIRSRRYGGLHTFSDAATHETGTDRVSPQRAIHELQQALGENTIFTSDIGEHLMFATHYLRVNQPDGYMAMTGLASMGTSVAAAVGIKLATRTRNVAAICGDGGFVMSVGDVITAATEKLGFVIAVLNDERYGMVELGLNALFGRTRTYPLGPVDIATIANGCGAEAHVIRQPGEIAALDILERLAHVPIVLDIRIDPSVRMPRSKRFESLLVTTKKS